MKHTSEKWEIEKGTLIDISPYGWVVNVYITGKVGITNQICEI